MIIDNVDQGTVRVALQLAGHAPSVHNSQPWRWVLGQRSVHLYADLRRWLPVTDADGRDLVMSCGAALHHLRVALAASGIAATVHRLPDAEQLDHLAALELGAGTASDTALELASAIVKRRTDRRRFSDWEVPTGFVQELVRRAADEGTVLRPVSDPRARRGLLSAIHDAARTQELTPGYSTETALWSGRHAAVDGVPAANLLRDAPGTGSGTARRFSEGRIEQSADGNPDGALLMVLGTASDDPLSQLRAGEALSALVLYATQLGLATCPLSQPLEVDDTRLRLRDDVLGGTLSPQVVLRVGWAPSGPELPPTPRRPLDEVLAPLPQ